MRHIRLAAVFIAVFCLFAANSFAEEKHPSIDEVSQWATNAIAKTYSLDYRNWQKVMERVRPFYALKAWAQLEEEFPPLITNVEKEKLNFDVKISGKPELLKEGPFGDAYTWEIKFPFTLVSWRNGEPTNFYWIAQMLVGETKDAEKKDGLEILQFAIDPANPAFRSRE